MSDRASGPPVVERMTSFPRPQPTAHFRIDLEAAIHDRGAALLFWYTIAMIIGFVFIMVVKPLKLARKPCLDRADHGGRRLLIAEPAAPGQRLPGAEL